MSGNFLRCISETEKKLGFSVLARSPFIECATIKFLDNETYGILRTLPNSLPCFMSRGIAIHSMCHSATRMKKTTNIFPPNFLINFEDLDEMFLRICILFVVGLDTALGSVFTELGSA